MKNKITPSIWFHTNTGKLLEVIKYYKNIFGINFKEGSIVPLGNTPSGNSEMVYVAIFDQKYAFLSTEIKHDPLNDAISFIIECENQDEIDLYWDYFTKEGSESECGWCIDKLGLRWQIIPKNLAELMSKPNGYEILMKQKKINIAEYLQNNI